jgi:hypothetical protein
MANFQSVPAEKVKRASFVAPSGLFSRTRDLCRDGHEVRKIQIDLVRYRFRSVRQQQIAQPKQG